MKSGKTLNRFIFLAIATALSCVEPFDPSGSESGINVLVVEGYIHAGSGVTRITLSRVSPLGLGKLIHEMGAEVRIESEDHETYVLTEVNAGSYVSDTLDLPTNKQYRIFIKRSSGKEYISEFQSVKVTPPIDSIHWEWSDQLYIYANAHDDASTTLYYTWTLQEDWRNRGRFDQLISYNGDTLIVKEINDPGTIIYSTCYSKSASSKMILGTTQTLARDVISYPVTTIPASSSKLQDKYRIVVRQRTLTEDEYNYVMLTNKNSELTGSFFDPMPSQLFGNIHRVDGTDETVVGYIGSYTTQELALFIESDELPPHRSEDRCDFVDFENNPDNLRTYLSDRTALLPHETYYKNGVPHVIAVTALCIDCTLKPGYTSISPDW